MKKGYKLVNIYIPEELFNNLQEAVPWGQRSALCRMFFEKVINAFKKTGYPAGVLSGALIEGLWRIEVELPNDKN